MSSKKEDIPILKEIERLKETSMKQKVFDKVLNRLSKLKIKEDEKVLKKN